MERKTRNELLKRCVNAGYVKDNMEIDLDLFDEYEQVYILEAWEEIKNGSFIDTREHKKNLNH